MAPRTKAKADAPAADQWNEDETQTDDQRREATLGQAGPALSEAQLDGLDPIDEETHLDQAARRAELTNMQTDHEAQNGLDAVSGSPNPGVTEQQSAAHTQPGARGSDMSGRAPIGDPLAAVDKVALDDARRAFQKADRQDIANGKAGNEVATERSAGWRTARQLGVHKATLDALIAADKIEAASAPGMSHMPDTGRLYRIKRDRP